MKNFIISLTIIVLFFTSSIFVHASPPLPTPICRVEGVVKSVAYISAYDDPCVQSNNCPTDTEVRHPSRYYLQVVFSSVEYVSGETTFAKCDELVTLNVEKELLINEADLKDGDKFVTGTRFEGQVRAFGLLFLDSYQILDSNVNEVETDENNTELLLQNLRVFAAIAMVIFLIVMPYIVFTLVKRRKSK